MKNKIKELLPLSLIISVGVFLRLLFLGQRSFWLDEVSIVYSHIQISFVNLIKEIIKGFHICPLYELFMNYWQKLGRDEFTLRLPSVIFSSLALVVLYFLVKRLFDKKTALLSVFFTSISVFHIYYSQEARGYGLVGLLALLSICLFLKLIQKSTKISMFLFIIVNVAMFYTHFMSFLVFLSLQLWFFLFCKSDKSLKKKWLIITGIILIFLLPWVWAIVLRFSQSFETRYFDWFPSHLSKIRFTQLIFTLKNFSLGYNSEKIFYLPFSLLMLYFFVRGIYFKYHDYKKEINLCLLLVIVPIAIMFLISLWRVFYADRYVIPSFFFFFILVARGINSVSNKLVKKIVFAVFVFCTSLSLTYYYQDYLPGEFAEHLNVRSKKDHAQAADFVLTNFKQGDIVLHTDYNTPFPFHYYAHIKHSNDKVSQPIKDLYLRVDEKGELQFFQFREEQRDIDLTDQVDLKDYKRVWLIYSAWAFPNTLYPEALQQAEYHPEYNSVEQVKKYFDSIYYKVLGQRFKGIRVLLYEK